MSPRVHFRFSAIAVVLLMAATAAADCAAPSAPGVRICTPTQNSVVVYTAGISFNSTPAPGASITKFIVYDNNQGEDFGLPYQAGETLFDANIRNGFHHIVVNAWDSAGHLYQASVNFTIIGEGWPLFCAIPSTPGINFCNPPQGAILGPSYPVSAWATGKSKISALALYVDNKRVLLETDNPYLSTGV